MTKPELLLLMSTIDELTIFFDGNFHKVADWMTIENPLLGNIKPIQFYYLGRGHKVLSFVHNAIAENTPEKL